VIKLSETKNLNVEISAKILARLKKFCSERFMIRTIVSEAITRYLDIAEKKGAKK
jgi:hypothetical protein